jgi:uncharacterized protein YuzE
MAMTTLATNPINVNYDVDADVLYLALGQPVPASCDEDDEGLLVRYAYSDGQACGVTVMGFRDCQWNRNVDKLSVRVAHHLGIEPKRIADALSGLHS